MTLRVLVVGAGGIGGCVSAYLNEIGADVTTITTNTTIAQAVQRDGFILVDDERRVVSGRLVTELDDDERFDTILLATQPPQVEAAARSHAHRLSDRGRMVCFQNGLCESRVGQIVGDDRVVGGVIAWGASMREPGEYTRTSAGGFTLGLPGMPVDDYLRELGSMLEVIGPVKYTDNLLGARWSKLALNCGISSLGTIGGARLGTLLKTRRYRRLCLEVWTEVVQVAHAAGIRLEKVAGTIDLDWVALKPDEITGIGSPSLAAKHSLLLAVGFRYRKLRSSMLSAIERGRPPSVDFLNGEVVTRGDDYGVDTPVNAAIVELIHDIAAGNATSSTATLDRLFEATR